MLRVVVTRFVRAFDTGGPQADMEFWERIIDETGTHYISGWITAFCAWGTDGQFLASRKDQGSTVGQAPQFQICGCRGWTSGRLCRSGCAADRSANSEGLHEACW